MLGKMLNDRYKIIKELGKGGMAVVYEAQDTILDRKVAIKMLRPEHVADNEFIKKFHHEAKAVARLSHPNVVSIFDIGQDGDYHYLVMEDIEGKDLKTIINNRERLPLTEALDIAKQICAALTIAHQNDIIHCDIKPHNILITPDKQVKVTDFGIARAVTSSTTTMTDTIMGSANYFSPEQAKGGKIKTHSDLYSVGIVLYEMVTGEVPFEGDSPISVALKHIKEEPRSPVELNPKIPEKLEKLIMKALAKNPEERFQKASTMREALTSVLQDLHNKEKKDSTIVVSDTGDTKVLKKSDIYQETKKRKKVRYTDKDTEKTKQKNGVKLALTIISVLAVSALIAFFIYQSYMDVPIVKVPDVVGLNYEDAKSELSQVGLSIEKQKDGVYHPEVPEGKIISQTPSPGERIRQTRPVTVTVSKGPAVITLPDLTGRSLRQSEIILDNQKIKVGEKQYEYNSEVPKNHVISQSPEPGEEMRADEKVDLLISKGVKPNMVTMPDLIGLEKNDALKKLQDNNLNLGNLKQEMTKRFKENQVAAQEYQAGKEIAENSKVDLTISDGIYNPNNNEINTIRVNVNVRGFEKQEIKIIVIDDNGRDVVYNKMHQPGDFISQIINSVGPTVVEVYYDGELKHKREIGDQI